MTTGPQSNLSPTTTLGSPADGSANAPSGTPELSTLLSGYSATPQWKVAGVNYYVGISGGTVLLNPASSASSVNSSSGGTSSTGTGAASGSGGVTDPTGGTTSGSTSSAGTGTGTGAGTGTGTPGAVGSPTAPVLTVADRTLSVSAGKSVDLGLGVSIPKAGDSVTVNIKGLPRYETIADNLDHKTFSGSDVTLTAAQVNSGLTLSSDYHGRGNPSATLAVTATDHTGAPATSAAQSILVNDPAASPVAGASGSKSNGSGSTRSSGLASSSQGGWSARSTNGHQVDVSQWFDQHPGFAKAVNTLSDAVSSRPGTTSTVGSSADQTASAGGRAFALLSQMMAGDFGNGSHFAQNASSTAQPQRQTPNLLTRPLH